MRSMEKNTKNPWFEKRNGCPACASDKFKIIYRSRYDENPIKDFLSGFYLPQGIVEFEYLNGASYILCECETCGLIFQRDIPNDILMERLYEHWIDPKMALCRHMKEGTGYYSSLELELLKIISFFRKEPSQLCFLDFGMGWGDWASKAKSLGCDSYGTELSAERIEHATSNGIKVIHWNEIPRHRFDFINTEQVLEHIPEPLKTLRHLRSALKTEGIIKVSVPTANNIKQRLKIMDWKAPRGTKNSLIPVAPLEHINFFTRKSLLKMAAEAGMEEVVIPMWLHYKYITHLRGTKWIARGLVNPISRNILKSQSHILFRSI